MFRCKSFKKGLLPVETPSDSFMNQIAQILASAMTGKGAMLLLWFADKLNVNLYYSQYVRILLLWIRIRLENFRAGFTHTQHVLIIQTKSFL